MSSPRQINSTQVASKKAVDPLPVYSLLEKQRKATKKEGFFKSVFLGKSLKWHFYSDQQRESFLLTFTQILFIYLFPFVQSKKKEIVCFCLKNRIQCFRCPEVVLIRGAHFPSFKRLRRSEVVFHACSLIFFLTSKKQQPELSQLWRKAFVGNSLSSNAKRNLHSY